MRKTAAPGLPALLLFLALGTGCPFRAAAASFSTGLGVDLFNYRSGDNYLSIDLALIRPIAEEMELELGAEFGLTSEPRFFVPLAAGLNFTFPGTGRMDLLVGFGITPVFARGSEAEPDGGSSSRFYMGPYLKAGVRFQTHRHMRLQAELQQDLLIGPPDWINTATRFHVGMNVDFPAR